ncbi:restriction endonuclease subunit S [Leuconostoc citreum]|uniref:restriction endonuclease subunit S n=1 Tax=Leuconostoc citreum TaxID=33964 RepID=UPI002A7FF3CD|nr:restriction endonuclease subunit S [Leuconostoc citreum]MDY5162406.1 restriction endonuclease subunit S [Leuconostoc citreum]MDY5166097.1 restriction endonuclease subunit S [Leuconostoc citreum]
MSKKTPQIRFKGFTDDWEERKLGQYTKLITKGTTPKDKTGIGDVNFVKVENITNGKIYPINKIKQNEHDNYLKRSRLEEKDILFSIAGTLGRTAIVNKSILPANTNQALAIIRGYDFDTNFLITSLAGNVVKEYIRRNPTVGAQPNLSLEQVGNLLVNTPNAEEQQKIGSFFQQLDETIALHQRKLDLLKEQKKGFLQKMFPKNGAKIPELRFEGFSDDWEERKLGDITKISTGKLDANAMVENGKYDFYTSGIKKYRIDVAAFEGPSITIAGNGATVGYMHLADNKFNAYQRTYVLQEFLVDRSFIFSEIGNKLPKKIKQEARTGNIPYIVMDMLTELKLSIPQNNSEQQKIGSFFKQLDTTIALHQRKLDLLKEQKKGFLQKMFVS